MSWLCLSRCAAFFIVEWSKLFPFRVSSSCRSYLACLQMYCNVFCHQIMCPLCSSWAADLDKHLCINKNLFVWNKLSAISKINNAYQNPSFGNFDVHIDLCTLRGGGYGQGSESTHGKLDNGPHWRLQNRLFFSYVVLFNRSNKSTRREMHGWKRPREGEG